MVVYWFTGFWRTNLSLIPISRFEEGLRLLGEVFLVMAKSDHITKQSIGLPFAVIETFFVFKIFSVSSISSSNGLDFC